MFIGAMFPTFFPVQKKKVKQSIVYIAISQCFHFINFITSSGTKEMAFLVLNDHF